MVADMVAFVASQFTTSTWDVGAQELCSVVLIISSHAVPLLPDASYAVVCALLISPGLKSS